MTNKMVRPELATFIAKWARIGVVSHEQERCAREDYSAALIVWQTDEIERLRLALDFYADESNWVDKYDHLPYCEADRDLGMRARTALKPYCAAEPETT